MARSPKDKETDRLIREVAAPTGENLTDAIRKAVSERLERERLRRGAPADLAARLRAIGQYCASLPDYDTRSPDEIVGYDETGMWTWWPSTPRHACPTPLASSAPTFGPLYRPK